MTWTCNRCGKVMTSELEYRQHVCAGSSTRSCPHCGGTGVKVNVGAPNTTCPACGGSGRISY